MRVRALSIALLLLVHLPALAQQDNVLVKDAIEIHYSVFNSSFITPDIASRYGLTRGKDKAIINIAVRERVGNGQTVPRHAEIRGQQYDLVHTIALDMQEIVENNAIYYLASYTFQDRTETYFTFYIRPLDSTATMNEPIKLQFNKLLYKDE